MKKLICIFLLLLISQSWSQDNKVPNPKFAKWQSPSYFRGYNILYESPHTLQDFIDFKNYGGNIFHIGTRGFLSEDAPYSTVQTNINKTDTLVNFCRQAGIHYVIAVRSGPGAYDTYIESSNQSGESRIWNTGNTTEQRLYADMLKMIVQRYQADTLFVGINLVVEPRPKVRSVPANNSALYKTFLETVFNIHMDAVYRAFVSKIRSVDSKIPVILENFGYSTPELFPPYTVADEYVVYSTHSYQPVEYSKAATPFSMTYPGVYWNITFLAQVLWDSTFVRETLLSRVREFQLQVNAPILLGEFGMYKPQNGGTQFISDMLGACKEYGWHFGLWDWRRGPGADWNIENFAGDEHSHWRTTLKYFPPPPVPMTSIPSAGSIVSDESPEFQWDSLTAYTTYDVRILDDLKRVYASAEDLIFARWEYSGNSLQDGKKYYWQVRAKNPGGLPENSSAWSVLDSFMTPSLTGISQNNNMPDRYELHQNYPNPFNPSTLIKFDLPRSGFTELNVYDISGKLIKKLYSSHTNAGRFEVTFDGTSFASGIYIIKLTSSDFISVKKMILVK